MREISEMSRRMMDLLRPSFNLANTNPFRRFRNHSTVSKSIYVVIRKYVLKNTRGSIRSQVNVSGPKEVIGLFANHVYKQIYNWKDNIANFKHLEESNKQLPSCRKVLQSLKKSENKSYEEISVLLILLKFHELRKELMAGTLDFDKRISIQKVRIKPTLSCSLHRSVIILLFRLK